MLTKKEIKSIIRDAVNAGEIEKDELVLISNEMIIIKSNEPAVFDILMGANIDFTSYDSEDHYVVAIIDLTKAV